MGEAMVAIMWLSLSRVLLIPSAGIFLLQQGEGKSSADVSELMGGNGASEGHLPFFFHLFPVPKF